MKAYAVLRGFPGLGRVMSGMEILRMLRDDYGYETRLFTYFNGEPLANSMEFEIDKIAPTLVISGVENGGQTSGGVTLSELSEESTVTVKLNDETIDYEIGETLAKIGKYTVTVTDECGNESVYEFEILKAKKPVNVGLIIAFVVSMMVAVGAATFLIIKKKREG